MNRGNMARFGANAEEDHLQIFIPYNRFYTKLDSGELNFALRGTVGLAGEGRPVMSPVQDGSSVSHVLNGSVLLPRSNVR